MVGNSKILTYRNTSERGVKHDIVAFELAAVLLQFEFFAKSHKSWCCEISVLGVVNRFVE